MTASRLGVCSLGAFMVALIVGCLTARQVVPISYGGGDAAAPLATRDYDAAVKAIARVMVDELKFPPIDAVVIVYPTVAEYEAGFVAEIDANQADAAAKTHFLGVASCKHKKVLLNGYRLARHRWSARVKTLAHEMTHIAQFSLADATCVSSDPWLREGFANWVAYTVLDRLKLESFAKEKESVIENVAAYKSRGKLPSLGQLSAPPDWAYWVRSVGADATYGESFLAVDFLIVRKGLPATIDYFKLFARSGDRRKNFQTAFGEDVARFEEEFAAHLKTLPM